MNTAAHIQQAHELGAKAARSFDPAARNPNNSGRMRQLMSQYSFKRGVQIQLRAAYATGYNTTRDELAKEQRK